MTVFSLLCLYTSLQIFHNFGEIDVDVYMAACQCECILKWLNGLHKLNII